MTVETVTRAELAELLERNTYPSAGAAIAAGEDPLSATRYFAGRCFPPYNDDEGLWVASVPTRLRTGALVVV